MAASNRRHWTGGAALVLLVILPGSGNPVLAATPGAAADLARCQADVRKFAALAPVLRRSDERIVKWLDAGRYPRAVSALRSATSRYADAWAGYTLGGLYAAGLGVPRSADRAFRWYLWSAKRGDRFAQRQVANAYLDGDGTTQDAAQAAYWFRMGVAPWQLAVLDDSLSRTYAGGRLAPVNRSKSDYYLDRSVSELRDLLREPNGEAAYYLGLDYEYGRGVRRDRAQAVGYLCRAAELQYAPAMTAIRKLQKEPR